jgi:hypothetical protein
VPTFGRITYWARSYVAKILATRATMGEYQPHKGHAGPNRKPDGPPIPKYFPKVVDETEWDAARAALESRRQKGGRPSKRVNLWTGLVHDARDGGSLFLADKGKKGGGTVLTSYQANQGVPGAKPASFPLATFEAVILSPLREIKPQDILPAQAPPSRVPDLEAEVDRLNGKITKLKADFVAKGQIASTLELLHKVEALRRRAADELAEARREAANPLESALENCHTLLDALAKSPNKEETRVRLRAAIRSIVEGVWCVFTMRGRNRLAAVQVVFKGGGVRHYAFEHEPAWGSQSGKRSSRILIDPALPNELAFLDLRNRDDAALAEQLLTGAITNVPAKPAGKRPKKITVTIGKKGEVSIRTE